MVKLHCIDRIAWCRLVPRWRHCRNGRCCSSFTSLGAASYPGYPLHKFGWGHSTVQEIWNIFDTAQVITSHPCLPSWHPFHKWMGGSSLSLVQEVLSLPVQAGFSEADFRRPDKVHSKRYPFISVFLYPSPLFSWGWHPSGESLTKSWIGADSRDWWRCPVVLAFCALSARHFLCWLQSNQPQQLPLAPAYPSWEDLFMPHQAAGERHGKFMGFSWQFTVAVWLGLHSWHPSSD